MIAEKDEQPPRLIIEGSGKLPATEFRLSRSGTVEFRYLAEEGEYPGFDSRWRVISAEEQREHLRMGGQIAEWLRSIGKGSRQ